MRSRASFITALGILTLIGSGCASFPQNELPKYSPNSIDLSEKWPAIDYELTYSVMGTPNAVGLSFFEERVRFVFGASGALTRFQAGSGGELHHLSLSLDNHGNAALAAASGFVSGLTLMILPGYAKDEYRLVAEVSRGSHVLKRYEYHDSMATWTQILLVFAMPFNFPTAVSEEVIDNMIWNLIVDLERDGILERDASEFELEKSRASSDTDGQSGAEATTLEKLIELKVLLDDDLITEEQYHELREQILGDL